MSDKKNKKTLDLQQKKLTAANKKTDLFDSSSTVDVQVSDSLVLADVVPTIVAQVDIVATDGAENAVEYDENSYKIKLEKFEGPLDLLLHLVKSAKIKIEEIFISHITEQYLEYMNQIKSVDLETASEFIEMAAWLIEIKSKSLLPKPKDETEENDPGRQLIQKLEEYKLYKEASEKMREHETVGIHYRLPDPEVGEPRFVLRDMNMDGLMKALQKMFLKIDKRGLVQKERKITLDRFSVADKIAHIKDIMLIRESASFEDLFEEDYTKSEIITTFQAMLELLKLQYIKAEQSVVFGEIILHRVAQ